jgi:hypothetical protein
MKFIKVLLMLIAGFAFFSCGEEDHETEEFNYEITFMQPSQEDKQAGESIHIHINFDESNAKTVHHINVVIKDVANGTELYSKPDVAHVHQEDGHYEHHDDFVLDVDPDTDLLIEAKVWGHEAGVAEETKSIQFHVN